MDSLAQDGRPERVETDGKSEEQGKDYVLDDAEHDDKDEEASGGDGEVMDTLEI